MPKFTRSNRHNHCQVCGDTSGACGTGKDHDLLYCMYSDGTDAPVGFRFVGRTKGGGDWARFAPDDGRQSAAERDAWRNPSPPQRRAKQARRADSLPAAERDRAYRAILAELTLDPVDRADLHRRGFSDAQIERAGFKSVARWHRLKRRAPSALPGTALGGRSLVVAQPGYLCPVLDLQGRIVGAQLRVREGSKGGRYRWVSSAAHDGPRPHLPNGELPLSFIAGGDRLLLVEGTGPKPWKVHYDTGASVLGAAGGQWAGSPEQLREAIASRDWTAIELLPDAGAARNHHVLRAYAALQALVPGLRVRWWGQATKAAPDADELPLGALDEAAVLSWGEFLGHCDPAVLKAAGLRTGVEIVHWSQTPQRQAVPRPGGPLMPLRYKSDDRLAVWQWVEKHGLTALDTSAAGTGKTHAAAEFLAETPGDRQRVFASATHRNPEVEGLRKFPDMPSKHSGLVWDSATGDVRHPREGDVEGGNCERSEASCFFADTFAEASKAGQPCQAGKTSPLCQACPWAEIRRDSDGTVKHLTCAYLKEVAEVAGTAAYRAHLSTVRAAPEDRRQTVIIDEGDRHIEAVTKRGAGASRINLEKQRLADSDDPGLLELAKPAIDALQVTREDLLFNDGKYRYGLSGAELLMRLPSARELAAKIVASGRVEAIFADDDPALAPALLRWLARKVTKPLRKSVREALSHQPAGVGDRGVAEVVRQQCARPWLPAVLRAIAGDNDTALWADSTGLTLTGVAYHHRTQIGRANAAIVLDATANPSDMARKIGRPVFWIEQTPPQHQNLTIAAVKDTGKLTADRRDREDGKVSQTSRARALVAGIAARHTQAVVFDLERFHEDYDGIPGAVPARRFVEGRGSNRYKSADALVAMGAPMANLAALACEWAALNNRLAIAPKNEPKDGAFWAWVRRRSHGELIQECARLRSHCSETAQTLYLAGNLDPETIAAVGRAFPGATHQTLDAIELAPEAASKGRQTQRAVLEMVQDSGRAVAAGEADKPITAAEIAERLGIHRSNAGRAVKEATGKGFRATIKTCILLFEALNSKTQLSDLAPEELELAQALRHLALAVDIPDEAAVAEIERLDFEYGRAAFERAVQALPAPVRAALAARFSATPASPASPAEPVAAVGPPPPE